MGRPAGRGKVARDSRYNGPGMIKASLYNFDIDGAEAKEDHVAFLVSEVIPKLTGNRGHIWMQGAASQSGSDAHNLRLSRRRVENVAGLLRARGVLDRQMQLDAVGESMAVGHAREDEADRAVQLVVIPTARESPPPAQRVPPPPPVSSEFKIRMLGGLAGTLGRGQVESLFFQIWDPRNGLTAFYVYSSAGIARGLSPAFRFR